MVRERQAEAIIEAFLAIYPQQKENIMTAAQQLRRQGRQEGRQEERLFIVKNMLEKKLEPALIREVTGLGEKEISKLLTES